MLVWSTYVIAKCAPIYFLYLPLPESLEVERCPQRLGGRSVSADMSLIVERRANELFCPRIICGQSNGLEIRWHTGTASVSFLVGGLRPLLGLNLPRS